MIKDLVMILLVVVICSLSLKANATEFIYDNDGALVVIENAESVEYTYDSDGSVDIKVEPSTTERTYIYGADELTVVQPSPLGTFTY